MNSNDAANALDGVNRTEARLAERARWPFHRHAMFGLAEGLVVAAIAQPTATGGGMIAVAMSLLVICIMDDRRRHGMFISGWQAGPTRPLTAVLVLIMLAMVFLSLQLRDGENAQPLGYLIGAVTFAICTGASLLWEQLYRAQLAKGVRQ